MSRGHRNRIIVAVLLIAAFVAGFAVNGNQDATRTAPRTPTRPQAFSSVTDNLGCPDDDNRTKAAASWYASGGGRDDAQARAGQANINTDDQNLVYEAARTNRGLIMMGVACNNDSLLQSIGEAWTNVLNSRVTYYPPNGASFQTWLIGGSGGIENFAYMYTMLWNMASIVEYIARITPASRIAWQNSFLTRWVPVLKAHYQQQIYDANWPGPSNFALPCGAIKTLAPYGTSIQGKEQQIARVSIYQWGAADGSENTEGCNEIRDAEQYIQMGFTDYARAHFYDPTNVTYSTSMTDVNVKKIVSLMNDYYWAQSITKALTNLQGVAVTGRYLHPNTFSFGVNAVSGLYQGLLTESGWAGDTDASLPPSLSSCHTSRAYAPVANLGEDTSHSNLLFSILASQRSFNDVAGVTNPITTTYMQQIANQFVYGMSNKSLSYPKFTNFISGGNGWQRALYNYTQPGSPPWESGTQGATVGWFHWGAYNADIVTMSQRWKVIWEATSGADYTWRVANLAPGGGKWGTDCVYNASSTLNVGLGNSYGAQMFYPSLVPFVVGGSPTTTSPATTTTTTLPASNDACPSSRTCLFSANPSFTGSVALGDGNPIVLGVRLRSSVAGTITHVRYWRFRGDSSTRTIRIYNTSGTLVTPAFTVSGGAEGWRNVALPTPVAIAASTDYIVTVDSPTGIYAFTHDVFTSSAVTSGVLTGPQTAASPNGNGIYGSSGMPTFTYRGISYGIDVALDTTTITTTTTTTSTTTTTTKLPATTTTVPTVTTRIIYLRCTVTPTKTTCTS